MENNAKEAYYKSLEELYRSARGVVETLADHARAHKLWDKGDFGKQLSALYMRLLQGPVRAVVMGVTSSGKSTLMNAIVGMPGQNIVPESADVCSPVSISFIRQDEKIFAVDFYTPNAAGLPVGSNMNENDLKKWHHNYVSNIMGQGDAQAVSGEVPGDAVPYVFTPSERMPRYATLIDTPGLNANESDTDTLYSLFASPAYMPEDEADLPELVLYVTPSKHGDNLSQVAQENLDVLMQKGVHPEHIYIIFNQFENTGLAKYFEHLNRKALDNLARSLQLLSAQAAEENDGLDMMEEEEARDHVLRLNAMFGRIHYVGAYYLMHNAYNNMPKEAYAQLKANAQKAQEQQDEIIQLRDKWQETADHKDYLPLIALRDRINQAALERACSDAPFRALGAVGNYGMQLLAGICAQIDGKAQKIKEFVTDQSRQMEDIKDRFVDSFGGDYEKLRQRHKEELWKLPDEMASARNKRIRSLIEILKQGLPENGSFGGEMARRALGKMMWGKLSIMALRDRFENILSSYRIGPKELLNASGDEKLREKICVILVAAYRNLTDYIREELMQGEGILQIQMKTAVDAYLNMPKEFKGQLEEKLSLLQMKIWNLQQLASDNGVPEIGELFDRQELSRKMEALKDKISEVEKFALPESLGQQLISGLDGQIFRSFSHMEGVLGNITENYEKLCAVNQAAPPRKPALTKRNVNTLIFNQIICPLLAETLKYAFCLKQELREAFDEVMKDMDKGLLNAGVEFMGLYIKAIESVRAALAAAEDNIRWSKDDAKVKALNEELETFRSACKVLWAKAQA